MEAQMSKKDQPLSPARSDQSSESEGRPVREKLKETRIDAQGTSDQPPSSDQAMKDAPTNGAGGDHSASGSDSERGRLRRKRSREHFEDDEEVTQPEKKHERHVRKKSREVTGPKESDVETTAELPKTAIPPIDKKDGDETMQSQELSTTDRQETPEDELPEKHIGGVASPKNKRTREQAEAGAEAIVAPAPESIKESVAAAKPEDERTTKRPRDTVGSNVVTDVTESKAKIPAGSGFANTSSISPFAAMSPKPQASKPTEAATKDLPQTSQKAFQSSGFSSFAKAPSPFSAAPGPASPFGAASGNKLSSFASSSATSTTKPGGLFGIENSSGQSQSAFGGLPPATKSTFGSSAFGQSLGSGFGTIGSPSNKVSFGSGTSITGLTNAPVVPFGAKEGSEKPVNEDREEDGDGDEGDDEGEEQTRSEHRASQTLLQSEGPLETGEENEDSVWTGRAKLYTLAGEAGKKSWQERGVGAIKLNVTREEPVKARFVLRADGTHRLLLNAAVTASMRFGNPEGEKPEDGKLLFTAPTASGEVESHLLKLKAERANELWLTVEKLKKDL